jgi:hypothetical protein
LHEIRAEEGHMLLVLGILMAVAWVMGWGVYHVASGAIHLLLLLALASVVLHFFRAATGTRRVV